MTVLVKKIPDKIYQSLGMLGSTRENRDNADELDTLTAERISKLISDLNKQQLIPEQVGKGSVNTYWELGKALHDVADNSKLLDKSELPLYWNNVKLYLPSQLTYKERGPNREHLWYCYRLASYPKKLTSKMVWSEWVTIFDSSGINQELRFDRWFRSKLSSSTQKISREFIRLLAPCITAMLGKIYTQGLTDEELFLCYDGAWYIAQGLEEGDFLGMSFSVARRRVQSVIKHNLGLLSLLMKNELNPRQYALKIKGDVAVLE